MVPSPHERPVTVGILLYDEVEVLDVCGPFEVFSTAARLASRHGAVPLRVVTIAAKETPIEARGGFRLLPTHAFESHPSFDVLVVPGGVTVAVERDTALLGWLRGVHGTAQLTVSVCTGAFLLAQAGVLDGRPATTHWEDEQELAERWPGVEVRREPRWVDDGDVITSAGISAGIDVSLHVVDRLFGRELAEAAARQMEYRWDDAP